jgi:aminopeptidase N
MKFKAILPFLLLAAAIECIPLSEVKKQQIASIPRDSFVSKRDRELAFGADLHLFPEDTNVIADDDDGLNYRLPNNSLPIRYNLWLKTDVHIPEFEFLGRVEIHLKIIEQTQVITLHYREITIEKVDLYNADGNLREENLRFNYNETVEFLEISLPNIEQLAAELILDITYKGILRSDSSGFYRASYQDANQNRVWFATTQFEMTDARHAMPCYDEPGIRAVTALKIQHDKSYEAISNMPVEGEPVPLEGTDYVTTTFKPTLPMQSYLLAFIISQYKHVSDNDPRIEQRVYARPEAIENGEGDYTLSVAGPILRQLEATFDVDYPLPKMDHAAVYDYIWGAMENFGLITYRENAILIKTDGSQESAKTSLRELVAHEYVHQYFGNIVAPKWWAYTWLNEGFATLFQYYICYLAFPESNHLERFQNAQNAAFNADLMARDAKPLNFYVQTPVDIRNKFGTISYQKGGSVLRMFQEALTVPTFTKGLSNYLKTMYFSVATPRDLHAALQLAFDDDFPGNGINLDEVMTTWEEQAGYPIVTVEKSGSRFIIRQKRYGGGNEIYTIPLSYATTSQADFETKRPKLWMKQASAEVQSSDSWMIVNIQAVSYYRIGYHSSVWEGLINQLHTNREVISPFHRVQLFKDMLMGLNEETTEVANGLKLLSYLDRETTANVWDQAAGVEMVFSGRLYGTTVMNKYKDFLKTLVTPHVTRLGYQKVEGESNEAASLREFVIAMSCKAEQQECFDYQREIFASYLETGTGTFDSCEGLRTGAAALHSKILLGLFNGEVTSNRNLFLTNLGCPLDKGLIINYLNVLIDSTNNLNSNERFTGLAYTLRRSGLALETTMDFVRDNFSAINAMQVFFFTSPEL